MSIVDRLALKYQLSLQWKNDNDLVKTNGGNGLKSSNDLKVLFLCTKKNYHVAFTNIWDALIIS